MAWKAPHSPVPRNDRARNTPCRCRARRYEKNDSGVVDDEEVDDEEKSFIDKPSLSEPLSLFPWCRASPRALSLVSEQAMKQASGQGRK